MKKLFFSSFIGVSIISWFFFLALLFINYFPSTFVKIIDNHFLTSLSVEFSNIENSGNLLNPSFHFYDFRVTQNKDLIIDTNGPTVVSVSSSLENGAYNAGDTINISVTFSEPTIVTDQPAIFLETGETDGIANFVNVSEGKILNFNYLVTKEDILEKNTKE